MASKQAPFRFPFGICDWSVSITKSFVFRRNNTACLAFITLKLYVRNGMYRF